AVEFADRTVDHTAAVGRVGQVAGNQHTSASRIGDKLRHLGGVVVLVQVGDQHIGSLAGVGDRHRPADPAVPAGDHRAFAGEFARSAVTGLTAVRDRIHR